MNKSQVLALIKNSQAIKDIVFEFDWLQEYVYLDADVLSDYLTNKQENMDEFLVDVCDIPREIAEEMVKAGFKALRITDDNELAKHFVKFQEFLAEDYNIAINLANNIREDVVLAGLSLDIPLEEIEERFIIQASSPDEWFVESFIELMEVPSNLRDYLDIEKVIEWAHEVYEEEDGSIFRKY